MATCGISSPWGTPTMPPAGTSLRRPTPAPKGQAKSRCLLPAQICHHRRLIWAASLPPTAGGYGHFPLSQAYADHHLAPHPMTGFDLNDSSSAVGGTPANSPPAPGKTGLLASISATNAHSLPVSCASCFMVLIFNRNNVSINRRVTDKGREI